MGGLGRGPAELQIQRPTLFSKAGSMQIMKQIPQTSGPVLRIVFRWSAGERQASSAPWDCLCQTYSQARRLGAHFPSVCIHSVQTTEGLVTRLAACHRVQGSVKLPPHLPAIYFLTCLRTRCFMGTDAFPGAPFSPGKTAHLTHTASFRDCCLQASFAHCK